MSPAILALGSFLAVVATVTAWPQPIRIIRTKVISGISAQTILLALITMQAWCGYTLRLRDWPAFVSSVGPLTAWLCTLILLQLHGHQQARKFLRLALFSGATILVITCGPWWNVLGYGAGLGSMVWAIPQLRGALKSEHLHGVSVAGYFLLTLEDLGWIVYATTTSVFAYALGPLIQGPACALIAWHAWKQRTTALPPK